MQGHHETARSSVLLRLGPTTATQSEASLPTQSPINLTFEYPVAGVDADLPWIMLMQGFNCYASDYTRIQQLLAGQGYLVAIVDEFHPISSIAVPVLSATREPQCSNDSFNALTGTMFGDVHSLLAQWTGQSQKPLAARGFPVPPLPPAANAAIKNVNVDSAVIVGHSAGGRVAIDMVTGLCLDPTEFLCPNYTKANQEHDTNVIKGIIAWESTGSIVMTNATLEIPDGVFMTYLSSNGTLAPNVSEAFDRTEGSCTSYIKLSSGNHYAITDWNPDFAPYQRAACSGLPPTAGDATTEAEQEERLVFIAELTDANIRAKVLNDSAAANYFVDQALNSPLVYMADLAPQCYYCVTT